MKNEINIISKIDEVNLAKASFDSFIQNINHENIQKIASIFQEVSSINENFSVFLRNYIIAMLDDASKLKNLLTDDDIKSFDVQNFEMQKSI